MIIHKGTQKIETERLILRRFKTDDAEDMFKNWATDKEVSKFLSWNTHKNVKETRQLIDGWIDGYAKDTFYNWVIELKNLEGVIGQISLVGLNEKYSSCEVGYNIGSIFWGQGIMTEALKAVIGYIFNDIGLNRIEARHNTLNPASGRVMQKCGMKQEGILRQVKIDKNGNSYDLAVYSILQDDYHGIN